MKKKYLYKIYSDTNVYIQTWADVITVPTFSTVINGSLSEMRVTLARSVSNFGENLDVKHGNIVKVYCVDIDQPINGVLIYTGFIASYEPIVDGGTETVDISLSGFWWELNRYLLEGDGTGIDSLIYGNGFSANLISIMTANNAPSPFVASAQTTLAGYDAYRAFSNVFTATEIYASNTGTTTGWLRIYLGTTGKMVKKYSVLGLGQDRQAYADQAPKAWTLEGSNDGSTWTVLDTQVNHQNWGDAEWREFEINNDNTYKYYQINVSANNGANLFVIGKLRLFEGVAFSRIGATNLKYLSQDPSNILKDILDKFVAQGGVATYGAGTVDLTGTVVSYDYNTATVQEAVKKIIELCPMDWYFYLGADSKIYLKPKSGAVAHKFHIGRNVSYYRQEKRLENIVNYIYFKGKNFYKKYNNSGSVSAYKRYTQKIVDERVTNVATADIMANTILNKMASPEIRITIRVTDNAGNDGTGYDIESIKVGDTCKIFNATSKSDNLWDAIIWDVDAWDFDITNSAGTVLQIQKITYHPEYVELEISNRQPDISKRIEDINRNLVDKLTIDNPVIPQ
jgi:hypothetical protein